MRPASETLTALWAGALLGGLVLGLVGRLATASIALLASREPNLSTMGVAESVGLGLLVGLLGGILLLPVRGLLPDRPVVRGVAVGAALFLGSLLFLDRQAVVEHVWLRAITLSTVFAIYAAFGVTLDRIVSRTAGDSRARCAS